MNWMYTKHGPQVHGPPLVDPVHGPLHGLGPWTTPVDHPSFWGFATSRPAAQQPGSPVLIFHSFFVQRLIHAHAQICTGFGRAKWMTVSLKSFTILIILSILLDPFFCCMDLSEKRCHSVYSSVYRTRCKLFSNHSFRLKILIT